MGVDLAEDQITQAMQVFDLVSWEDGSTRTDLARKCQSLQKLLSLPSSTVSEFAKAAKAASSQAVAARNNGLAKFCQRSS